MREILTTTADEAARATRFVQRTSPLGGATFTQTLVFGFLGNPQASLEALTHTAATLGVEISPQALDQRCTMSAATCVKQVLDAALTRVITADPLALPLLARFKDAELLQVMAKNLPASFVPRWHPRECAG